MNCHQPLSHHQPLSILNMCQQRKPSSTTMENAAANQSNRFLVHSSCCLTKLQTCGAARRPVVCPRRFPSQLRFMAMLAFQIRKSSKILNGFLLCGYPKTPIWDGTSNDWRVHMRPSSPPAPICSITTVACRASETTSGR